MHEDLMLSRRQKTLSSISNYIPLHILLNEPVGISFSITVSKSWTIEQLARQIEAEYAYLVEREIPGGSNYPVIECGALFDHVEFKKIRTTKGQGSHQQHSSKKKQQVPGPVLVIDGKEINVDRDQEAPQAVGESLIAKGDQDEGNDWYYDDDPKVKEEQEEEKQDHRTEAESRGVQLRFSDKVEDVLDRNSTVHVVNIDQGLGMGRKLSLTNLALAVSQEAAASQETSRDHSATIDLSSSAEDSPIVGTGATRTIASTHQSNKAPPLNRMLTPLPGLRHNHRLISDDRLSSYSSVLATQSSTPAHSPGIEYGEAPLEYTFDAQSPASLLREQAVSDPSRSDEGKAPTPDQHQNPKVSSVGTPFLSSPFASSNSLAATAGGNSPPIVSAPGKSPPSTSSRPSTPGRPRSRATDILLNLESSSNDARFQEILHNTIALDHFRQFCFQEYSIENLLFWMDVELFAKGGAEAESGGATSTDEKTDRSRGGLSEGQFAVQHARYIYLTYIDSCAPLQVNLSDETRTEIPWPLLDDDHYQSLFTTEAQTASGTTTPGSTAPSTVLPSPVIPLRKKKSRAASSRRAFGRSGSSVSRFSKKKRQQRETEDELVGWPYDRHMFDGAQEHTYQLMKGHTLVRFEESDLWKAVQKIIREQPEEYSRATITGSLSSHYKLDPTVILHTVPRSRSRHPSTNLQTLYNWNNSTSDLDRSRVKEDALARTMSQYFGPIPPTIRHPGRVTILGLGRAGMDDDLDAETEFDDFDLVAPLDCAQFTSKRGSGFDAEGNAISPGGASKRSSTGSTGTKRHRFAKRFSGGIGRSSMSNSNRHSVASDNPPSYYSQDQDPAHPGYQDAELDDVTLDSIENGKRTTRWMVAGYFDDQVRLTAAQRRRLLRRNNKLTKFFGSRVDGTLLPVEERIDDQQLGLPSSASASAVRSIGSGSTTLAYALSSSTIQDIPHGGKRRQSKHQLQQQCRLKKSSSKVRYQTHPKGPRGNGSESLLLLSGQKNTVASSSTGSSSLLRRFKKYTSVDDYTDYGSTSHPHDNDTTEGSGSNSSSSHGHTRSFTDTDAALHSHSGLSQQQQLRKRFAAHPHPLWSGSLSDQEGAVSTAFERRRGLSIMSVMDSSISAGGLGSGVSPTTPTTVAAFTTGYHASPQRVTDAEHPTTAKETEQNRHSLGGAGGTHSISGTTLDRQEMLSRRKKADKLSTFFGAQLTAVELSSQLKMDCGDDELLMSGPAAPTGRGSNRSSTEDSHKKKSFPPAISAPSSPPPNTRPKSAPAAPLAVSGPTFSSVNQLSTKERTILWKRNKKLRELLGESLPESAVALALTGPVLFGSCGGTTTISAKSAQRSSTSTPRRTSVASTRHLPQIPATGPSDISLAPPTQEKKHDHDQDEDGDGDGEDEDDERDDKQINQSNATSSVIRRRSGHSCAHRSTPSISTSISTSTFTKATPTITISTLNPVGNTSTGKLNSPSFPMTPVTPVTPSPTETMSRFRQKKRMDKIQQFLGDRVPEQDLWMGIVGREKTMAMLELDPLTFQSCPSSRLQQEPTEPTMPIPSGIESKKSNILGKNRLGGLGRSSSSSAGANPGSGSGFSRSGSSRFFERKSTSTSTSSSASPPASTIEISSPLISPPVSRGKIRHSNEETVEFLGISGSGL
ncbi:hypothetical protein BGZ83_008769 [Gryganskiella cystojenkinii]|nr:hypothetical protein BGZ83_008769 [Gryganskiella cystojenkinii]